MSPRAARTVLLLIWCGVMLCLGVLFAMSRAKAQESWWQKPDVARCCGEADAVYADDWRINPDGTITATVTAPGPRTPWAPIGRTYIVPADRIVKEPGNPLGRPLLFLTQLGHLYCFAMGAGI